MKSRTRDLISSCSGARVKSMLIGAPLSCGCRGGGGRLEVEAQVAGQVDEETAFQEAPSILPVAVEGVAVAAGDDRPQRHIARRLEDDIGGPSDRLVVAQGLEHRVDHEVL